MKSVIMAGGMGTRVSFITKDVIPKPMLKIGEKPILEHQIDCLKANGIVDIIIVVGHLGNVIEEYFGDGERFGVHINYIKEKEGEPLGTAGSLFYLKDTIKDDFLLVFGDVFFDIDISKMADFHKKHHSVATLLTHPNSHPFDSDLVVVDEEKRVTRFDSKDNDRGSYDYNNIVNSGIYMLSHVILNSITAPCKMSIEKDVITSFIDSGGVYSYHTTEYVKDMGTPERYKIVNDDYYNKMPSLKNLRNKQKCIFLDRDGTINEYKGYISKADDLLLINGAAEAIKRINSSEYLCIVITNQPVVARGECDLTELSKIHKRLETLLGREGAYIDDLYYCPHHPDKGFEGEIRELKIKCNCRKPKTGMVEDAARDHNICLDDSIVIGDSTIDIKMAENLGMKSVLLKTGVAGMDKKYSIHPDYIDDNLLSAVNRVLKN